MSDVDSSSPERRESRPARDRGNHFVAMLLIFGLSLAVAIVLQVVPLVIPLTLLGAMIYAVCVMRQAWLRKLLVLLLLFVVLALFAPAAGTEFLLEIPVRLVAGWWFFLGRTLPDVTVSVPEVATFLVVIALLVLGTQYVARRVGLRRRATDMVEPTWSFGQSLRLVSLFALSFVAGLACVGAVQQSGWLMNSPSPPLDYQDGGMLNRPKLHDMGSALFESRDDGGRFSSGITSRDGQPLHGWETVLLPHLDAGDLYNWIDLQQSWRSPSNREVFEQTLNAFQSRKFENLLTTTDGYATSHFAANAWVIRPGASLSVDEITDGDSNTILAGEVAENFRAWGDPFNIRDPALGLNHPDGFATPWDYGRSRAGVFLFADGHVQTIHDDVAPAIFEALGTPNAGDEAGEF